MGTKVTIDLEKLRKAAIKNEIRRLEQENANLKAAAGMKRNMLAVLMAANRWS